MSSAIQPTIIKEVKQASAAIDAGRLVAFPTGTSYGLAADTAQGHALQRLSNLKQRPAEKEFTIFMTSELYDTFLDFTDAEEKILTKPNLSLTLLVKPKSDLEHLAKDGLVGVRIIDHPVMKELAKTANRPLTATSANVSGQPPCFDPKCIQKSFPGKIDDSTYDLSLAYILDGGELTKQQPTTIAQLEGEKVKIVRAGSLSAEEITALIAA